MISKSFRQAAPETYIPFVITMLSHKKFVGLRTTFKPLLLCSIEQINNNY